jgi:hypothetical protein
LNSLAQLFKPPSGGFFTPFSGHSVKPLKSRMIHKNKKAAPKDGQKNPRAYLCSWLKELID